jgi:hypothetical protein
VDRQRILITVKTYPTLSQKYGETVCTAGVREDGSWVRIYPVPFRRLGEAEQYRKFDWVECRLLPNPGDVRPETFRPADARELTRVGHLDTAGSWRERRRLLLQTARVYDKLDEIIAGAKANRISLAVFRPSRVLDLIVEDDDREWDISKLAAFRDASRQHELFSDDSWRETFKLVPKLPYKFSYKFEDVNGRQSVLRILDWEIGALYWNCLRRANGDEREALNKVREKYFDDFLRRDLHFFLGTTLQWHHVAPNPWVVIGVLPIPHENQIGLL